MSRIVVFLLSFLIAYPLALNAQQQPQLTIGNIASGALLSPAPESVKWSPDGSKITFIQRDKNGERGELISMDVATHQKGVLISETKLASLAPPTSRLADERIREWRLRYNVPPYHWAPDSKSLLFDANGQFWLYRFDTGTAVQVTSSPDPSSDPKFSRDGKRIVYVRKHDLWSRELPNGDERQLTRRTEEEELILNGEVDWVYAEELDVRSNYSISPDSKQVLYLQMDERLVPTYPIVDYSQLHARADEQRFPNPGDKNPAVRLGVVDIGGGKTHWFKFPEEQEYIPRFGWVRPGLIWIQGLNRAQNKLVLYFAETSTGNVHAVLTEQVEPWINVDDNFQVLSSGNQFLWTSWRDGHTHIYLYSFDQNHPLAGDATVERQLTKGDFEVFSVENVDEKPGVVYFIADPNDPRQRQLFSVKLDGSGFTQITKAPGTHAASFGPADSYVDKYSSLLKPPALSLCKLGGDCTPISQTRDLSDAGAIKPEWIELTAADGKNKLYAQLYLPPSTAGGSSKIPIVLHPYGGPSGQSVRDEWGRESGLFQSYLASKGFAVLVVDNRGMANRGREFNAFLKGKFGEVELADQLAAVDEVAKRYSELDATNVGVYGHSYGGFFVLYAMTHSGRFKAGVSGAPVSSQRLYDSIWTERYLGLPANNEAGYNSSSPINDAAKLTGALRIVHGTSDDNVHLQNTIQMTQALIKAAKPFDIMLYPGKTHGIRGADAIAHMFHSIEDQFIVYLAPREAQAK
jgi:dipeptidyl-peptidase-4